MAAALVKSLVLLAVLLALPASRRALKVGFYDKACPSAEGLVRQAVVAAFATNQGVAPGLVRLHFHDCFVRGCDASVLIQGPGTELTAPANENLRGLDVIDAAKAAIEARCPSTVSCADIVAFAARDATALSGGFSWTVPAGRRDGSVSLASEATSSFPSPAFNLSELVAKFQAVGLTAEDMTVLSGAHSFGVSHCLNLFGDSVTRAGINPNMSPVYREYLRTKCPATPPAAANDSSTVFMDIITPDALDNRFYDAVLNNLGMFRSDHELMSDPKLLALVRESAQSMAGWAARFKKAMIKMGRINVKEGTVGNIRKDCRVLNPTGTDADVAGATAGGSERSSF